MLPSADPDALLSNFKSNVETLLKLHHMTRAELSRRSGFKNENKVSAILNSDSLPSMAIPCQIAQAFEVEVGDLFKSPANRNGQENLEVMPLREIDRQATQLMTAVFQAFHRSLKNLDQGPTLDTIIRWWKETEGRLANCDQLAPYFDLVAAPRDTLEVPLVQSVGWNSLSAHALGSHETSRLERFILELNRADLDELKKNIRTVSHSGMGSVTPQKRLVTLPGTNIPTEISFIRLMLPVTDAAGQPYVLNYSTLLSESSPMSMSGFDS